MNRIHSLILASICMMQVTYAQDSLTVKMNHIDEYRDYILNHRKDFLVVEFPLNMYLGEEENPCYIEREKPDTLFCYFQNDNMVLIEHLKDRLIDNLNCDTDFSRSIEYKRAFFEDGKICLEENYSNAYVEGWGDSESGKRVIVNYCYVEELRTYWDITIDKKLCDKSRSPAEDYVLETLLDSVLNVTKWDIEYADINSFDYKYDSGERMARILYLDKIKDNGLVLPEGLKLPYSK